MTTPPAEVRDPSELSHQIKPKAQSKKKPPAMTIARNHKLMTTRLVVSNRAGLY